MEKSKYTLITGASSGIGRELALVFARKRHSLILLARNQEKLDILAGTLKKEFRVAVEVMVQDLSVPTAYRDIWEQLERKSIEVDILVNNAGFVVYGNFFNTDISDELRMIQVNLISLTQLTKLLVTGMRKHGFGKILNLGSTGSFIPSPLNAVYSATKAYVFSFSEALAEELRGSGVTVTVLCPGATGTEFQQRAGMETVRLLKFGMMNPATVAKKGYRGLMKGKRVVVPGLINKQQVVLSRILPGKVLTWAAKKMLEVRTPN